MAEPTVTLTSSNVELLFRDSTSDRFTQKHISVVAIVCGTEHNQKYWLKVENEFYIELTENFRPSWNLNNLLFAFTVISIDRNRMWALRFSHQRDLLHLFTRATLEHTWHECIRRAHLTSVGKI